MKEIIAFIWEKSKKYKWIFMQLLFYTLVIQGVSLVSPYITGRLLDSFISGFDFWKAVNLILLGFGAAVISRIFWALKSYVDFQRFFFDFRKDISMQGVQKILDFSVGQHTDKNSGVKDTIMTKGAQSLKRLVEVTLYDLVPLVLKSFVILIGMFVVNWQLGIFGLVASVIIVSTQLKISKHYIPKFKELEKLGQDRHKGFWEVLRNIFLIKNSGRENYGYDHIDQLIEDEHNPAKKYWISFLFKIHASSILIAVASSVFMVIAVWMIGQGTLTPGMFVVVSAWAGMLFSELYMFQSIQRVFAFELPAAQELKEFMEIKPAIGASKSVLKPKVFEGKIEFKAVSFKYPDEDEEGGAVLDNVSFVINPKETIGVVGRSGSGKSTFIKLLLRNYDTTKGKITIDGIDLKRLNPSWYLQHIGYVEQST